MVLQFLLLSQIAELAVCRLLLVGVRVATHAVGIMGAKAVMIGTTIMVMAATKDAKPIVMIVIVGVVEGGGGEEIEMVIPVEEDEVTIERGVVLVIMARIKTAVTR